jgi:hypothetical protein
MLVKNEVEWSRHFAGMYNRAATITLPLAMIPWSKFDMGLIPNSG